MEIKHESFTFSPTSLSSMLFPLSRWCAIESVLMILLLFYHPLPFPSSWVLSVLMFIYVNMTVNGCTSTQLYHFCSFMWPSPDSRHRNVLSPQGSFTLPLQRHTQPIWPNLWLTINLFSISIILLFWEFNIRRLTYYITFWDQVFYLA